MKTWLIIIGVALVGFGVWKFSCKGEEATAELEYRYAKADKGELIRSITANGQLVALTTVDVKSKAGGIITRLDVEEGTRVKKGDLIAVIDPADTQAAFDRAEAQQRSDGAKRSQAKVNFELQMANAETAVADAEQSLGLAKIRLKKAELNNKSQPKLTASEIANAKAALDSTLAAKERSNQVTIPQWIRDAKGALTRSESDLKAATEEYKRQLALLEKGYTSRSNVDKAKAALDASQASYDNAKQRADTLSSEVSAETKAQSLSVARAEAAYDQAVTNSSQNDIRSQELMEAQRAVRQAEIALRRANDNKLNTSARKFDIDTAEASLESSSIQARNAKVQLDSATVYAPRDGVITTKYLEQGTIIASATSAFAQGTSIVQISDTTQMFCECAVDEADISQVRVGQKVRVLLEAFPGKPISGVVTRKNPSATTAQNITAIKVRVKLDLAPNVEPLPGMNATCEFITLEKKDVLVVPAQAVKRDGDKSYVLVKTATKPVRKDVTIGESGNDGVEILSGLTAGEEVVVAEIDLAALRATQQKMLEAQQGGGLSAGGPTGRPQQRPQGGTNGGRAGAGGMGTTGGGASRPMGGGR